MYPLQFHRGGGGGGESRGSGPCSRVVDVLTSDHEHVDCILRVKL